MSRENRKIESKADRIESGASQTKASELSEHDLNRVAGGGGSPLESMSLSYAKKKVPYTNQKEDAASSVQMKKKS
jgi:hypothetical protein